MFGFETEIDKLSSDFTSKQLERLQKHNDELKRQLFRAIAVIKSEYPVDQWSDYGVPDMECALEG